MYWRDTHGVSDFQDSGGGFDEEGGEKFRGVETPVGAMYFANTH